MAGRATSTHRKIPDSERKFLDLLDIWTEWMGKKDPAGRTPSRAPVFGEMPSNYSTAEDDSDASADKQRLLPAIVFDACVESLYAHERVAIYKAQGLRTSYGISWLPYEIALAEGMDRLRTLVARRC